MRPTSQSPTPGDMSPSASRKRSRSEGIVDLNTPSPGAATFFSARSDAYSNLSTQGASTPTEFHTQATFSPSASVLLNPKKTFAGQPTAQSNPRASYTAPSTPVSLDFQFATPADQSFSSPSQSPFDPSQASNYPNAPVNGFGGMIERVNNVDSRAAVPQTKRRKVVEESSYGGIPARFGGSGSGTLGQHVKDKREASASHPSKPVETVDLTEAGKFYSHFCPCLTRRGF